MISFQCPSWRKKLSVKEELAGKKGKCPQCRSTIVVPGAANPVSVRQGGAAGPESSRAEEPAHSPRRVKRRLRADARRAARRHLARWPFHSVSGTGPGNAGELATTAPDDLGHLGVYKLLKVLGQGGMGKVYQAEHTKLKKLVALKVLAAGKLEDKGAVSRFEREMVAVGRLAHPNIVQAMDAGEIDGTYFLVMEYVEGRDLSDVVKKLGPLPIADACELVRQAAVGLQERARAWHGSSRHQAVEPDAHKVSAEAHPAGAESPRPWPGPADRGPHARRPRPYQHRPGHGHHRLHGPGARWRQPPG